MTSAPPTIARWLLDHLVRGKKSEALAGDLYEEFLLKQSAPWYWRQVLKAIFIALLNTVRAERFVFAFALAWITMLASAWGHLMMYPRFQSLVGLGAAWEGPQSLAYYVAFFATATILSLWLALALYVATTGRFNSRKFLAGMLCVLFLDAATNGADLLLASHGHFSIYLVSWLPFFLILLLSIFVGRASRPTIGHQVIAPR
jgi:hypothetical protein